jgi:hypothetical protein
MSVEKHIDLEKLSAVELKIDMGCVYSKQYRSFDRCELGRTDILQPYVFHHGSSERKHTIYI